MKRPSLLLLAAAAACAHVDLPPPPPAPVPGAPLTVEVEAGVDRGEQEILVELAAEALPALARWGGLRVPTRIVVLPDHAALEARTEHFGYPWLHAWARYDVVYLQSPRTWEPLGLPAGHGEQRTILIHELTHCAMYQAVGDQSDWIQRDLPLWFREGMASWTAHQENRRLSRQELGQFLLRHPGADPLGQAEALYQRDEVLVYAAGHWAFDLLASRGTDRVNQLLSQMRTGLPFARAFEMAFGEAPESFVAHALRLWRGDLPEGDSRRESASSPQGRL